MKAAVLALSMIVLASMGISPSTNISAAEPAFRTALSATHMLSGDKIDLLENVVFPLNSQDKSIASILEIFQQSQNDSRINVGVDLPDLPSYTVSIDSKKITQSNLDAFSDLVAVNSSQLHAPSLQDVSSVYGYDRLNLQSAAMMNGEGGVYRF